MSRKTTLTVRPRHNCDAKVMGWKVMEGNIAIESTSKADAEKSLGATVRNRIAEGYTHVEVKSYNHDNQLAAHATYKVAADGTVSLEEHKTPALRAKPEGAKPKPATAVGDGYTPKQRAKLAAAAAGAPVAPKAAAPKAPRTPKAPAAAAAPAADDKAAKDAKLAKGRKKYQSFVKKFKAENADATKEAIAAAWAAKKGGTAAPKAAAAKAPKAPKAAAAPAKAPKAPKAPKAAAGDKPKRTLTPEMEARNAWVWPRIKKLKAAGMDHKEAFSQAQTEYSAAQGK